MYCGGANLMLTISLFNPVDVTFEVLVNDAVSFNWMDRTSKFSFVQISTSLPSFWYLELSLYWQSFSFDSSTLKYCEHTVKT